MADNLEGRWCLLRTRAASTLTLRRTLTEAGFDAWTPSMVRRWRKPRGQAPVERPAPILPTFVFLRAAQLADLNRALTQPANPHPAFSVFRYAGNTPLIAEGQMIHLRAEEMRAAEAYAGELDRERRNALKAERKVFAEGSKVRVPEVAFEGLTGVVVSQKGNRAVVNFGGGRAIVVKAWLLQSGEVVTDPARTGNAA